MLFSTAGMANLPWLTASQIRLSGEDGVRKLPTAGLKTLVPAFTELKL